MSIASADIKSYNRSKGHNAVAAAAYRMRTRMTHNGITYDYTKHKSKAEFTYSCSRFKDEYSDKELQSIWQNAEDSENRKNSIVFHGGFIAFPNELSEEGKRSVMKSWIKYVAEKHDIFVSGTYHKATSPSADSSGKPILDSYGNPVFNDHFHPALSARHINEDGTFGEKWREISVFPTNREIYNDFRDRWERLVNQRLGYEKKTKAFINMKSYKKQGVDKIPQKKIGRKLAHAKDAKGIELKNSRILENEATKAFNKKVADGTINLKNTQTLLSQQIKYAEKNLNRIKLKSNTTGGIKQPTTSPVPRTNSSRQIEPIPKPKDTQQPKTTASHTETHNKPDRPSNAPQINLGNIEAIKNESNIKTPATSSETIEALRATYKKDQENSENQAAKVNKENEKILKSRIKKP